MSSDWTWSFRSEYGRDVMLRDRLEELESESDAASNRASRLSSQLARVQGSLETRLTALSRAFDAYVELGDVPEQLLAFTGTAEIRRRAVAAIAALGRRATPQPMPPDSQYWLVLAMTAVIARAGGGSDPEAEQAAIELDREAELFIVATLGALGHGGQVVDRLPSLLVTDDALDPGQQALWQAAAEGLFGPSALPSIRSSWAAGITGGSESAHSGWTSWIMQHRQVAGSAAAALQWIRDEFDAPPPTTPPVRAGAPDFQRPVGDHGQDEVGTPASLATPAIAPAEAGVDRLRRVAERLIVEGRPDERELLARSRALREVIERPDAQPGSPDPMEAAGSQSIPAAVQNAYLQCRPGSAERRELLSWLTPVLTAVVEQLAVDSRPTAVKVVAQTPGGRVDVTSAGPDSAQMQRAKQAAAVPDVATRRITLSAVSGVLLVLTAVLVATGHSGWAAVFAVATVILVILAGIQWRRARMALLARAQDVADVDRAIAAARERAVKSEQTSYQAAALVDRLHAEASERLRAGPTPVANMHEGGPA